MTNQILLMLCGPIGKASFDRRPCQKINEGRYANTCISLAIHHEHSQPWCGFAPNSTLFCTFKKDLLCWTERFSLFARSLKAEGARCSQECEAANLAPLVAPREPNSHDRNAKEFKLANSRRRLLFSHAWDLLQSKCVCLHWLYLCSKFMHAHMWIWLEKTVV